MKINTPIKELVKMKIDKNTKLPIMQQQSEQIQPYGSSVYEEDEEDPIPEEFITFMDYCREIKFEEKPDYNYLRRILKDLFNRNGYEYDYVYDWNI